MGAHVCGSRLMSGISLCNSSILFIEITLELDATVKLTCSRNLLSLPLTAAVMGGPRLPPLRVKMQALMLYPLGSPSSSTVFDFSLTKSGHSQSA